MEPRLQKRYRKLVQQHLSTARGLAAGLRVRPHATTAMAAALAAYRFYANPRVSLVDSAAPLRAYATQAARSACVWSVAFSPDGKNSRRRARTAR